MEEGCRTACGRKHLAFPSGKHTELMKTVLSEAPCDSVRSSKDEVDMGLRVQARVEQLLSEATVWSHHGKANTKDGCAVAVCTARRQSLLRVGGLSSLWVCS